MLVGVEAGGILRESIALFPGQISLKKQTNKIKQQQPKLLGLIIAVF